MADNQTEFWRRVLNPPDPIAGNSLVEFDQGGVPPIGALKFPIGTTAQRPSPGVDGYMRFNTTLGDFEFFNTTWQIVSGAGGISLSELEDVDDDTKIFVENSTGADDDIIAMILGDPFGLYDESLNALTFSVAGFSINARVFLFFGCAILFTNLFRGEVLNKTLHFYFLAPIRREVLAAGKYLSGLVAAITLYCLSVALSHVTMYMHFGPQFHEFYFQGPGLGHLAAYVAVTALACIGYGAVFTVMGLIFRNPMIPAAIVLVWEGLNPFLPPLLKKFSVLFYLTSMTPVGVPAQGPMAFLAPAADPVSPWLAVPGLLLVSALAMIYAGIRTRKFEVNYAE